jgi:hypothetical protein
MTTDVTSLVLGALGVVTVVASFAFSLAVLVMTRPPQALPLRPAAPAVDEPPTDESEAVDSSDPMSRVLRDIERLATLREQGALTEKEFTAQKAKLLPAASGTTRTAASTRARRPQRTS